MKRQRNINSGVLKSGVYVLDALSMAAKIHVEGIEINTARKNHTNLIKSDVITS